MKKEKLPNKKKRRALILRLPLPFKLLILGLLLLFTNLVFQFYKKPAEIIGLFDVWFHKTPFETWTAYSSEFKDKSTNILTPDLLAALAQIESNGNPIARTYWKWRATKDLGRLFSPASSAAGMYQITDGTFNEAKDFCIEDQRAIRNRVNGECFGNIFYSRLIPSHAIEMTAARLHYYTREILGRMANTLDRPSQQAVAISIHLCGVERARVLTRNHSTYNKSVTCGDHNLRRYIEKVRHLQRQFVAIAKKFETESIVR